jgi:RimJ/RimL family protein N-acetyltransferase
VLSFNTAVVAMHKKFGFVEEGLLRDHWCRDGEWVDTHVLAMFEDTWAERRKHFGEQLRSRGLI